jgi:excisionase family DNA binding protein
VPAKKKGKRKRHYKPRVTIKVTTEWMAAEEATEYLRLPSIQALYKMVAREKIPAYRLGKRTLIFSRSQIDEFIRSRPVLPPRRRVKPS